MDGPRRGEQETAANYGGKMSSRSLKNRIFAMLFVVLVVVGAWPIQTFADDDPDSAVQRVSNALESQIVESSGEEAEEADSADAEEANEAGETAEEAEETVEISEVAEETAEKAEEISEEPEMTEEEAAEAEDGQNNDYTEEVTEEEKTEDTEAEETEQVQEIEETQETEEVEEAESLENTEVTAEDEAIEEIADEKVEETEIEEITEKKIEEAAEEDKEELADKAEDKKASEDEEDEKAAEELTEEDKDQSAEAEKKEEKAEEEKEEEKKEEEKEEPVARSAKRSAPSYGTPTGKSGAANTSGNVVYTEYENNGEYVLVFSVIEAAGTVVNGTEIKEEDCTINVKFRNSEFAARTTKIVVEEGVTGIGWNYVYNRTDGYPRWPDSYPVDTGKTDIFNGFSKLTTVEVPSTLKRIGWSAFKGCAKLENFDLTVCTQLEEIFNQAFQGCKKLNEVDLSACGALTTIGWSAFRLAGEGSGAALRLPTGGALAVIGGHAFEDFGKNAAAISFYLRDLPEGVEILEKAFTNCACVSNELPPDPNKPYTVVYSMVDANGSTAADLPQVIGGTTDEDLAADATHVVRDVDSYFYIKLVGSIKEHYPYRNSIFKGWTAENGSLLLAGEEITDLAALDADGDHNVVLTAAWCSNWQAGSGSTGLPTSIFSIWTNVSSANSLIDADILLSEKLVNYTPKVGGAILYGLDSEGNMILPDQLKSPSINGTKYMMISYVGSTIVAADKAVRQLAEEGYTAVDPRNGEVTWKLSWLPTDEEVLSDLAAMVAAGDTVLVDESGDPIAADELTTDNFVVRWCVAKYQSVSADGWNINGKLTRKIGYTTITKTFFGDEEVVNTAISGGFNITLTDLSTGAVNALKMADMTSQRQTFGLIGENNEGGKDYGYIERSENADGSVTYKWVVPCYEEKHFSVKENEYSVTLADGSRYGTRVQYNQTTVGSAKLPWNSETIIETHVSPSDDPDLSHYSVTNFFNTYYPQGSFVINVIDSSWKAMAGVEFTITDVNGAVQKLYKADAANRGEDGLYNMLYENGRSSSVAYTNAGGNLFLAFRVPTEAEGSSTYIVNETIPEGCLGHGEAGAAARFRVTVYADGSFDVSGIEMTYGSIRPLSEAGAIYGVQIVNTDENCLPAPTGLSFAVQPYVWILLLGFALVALRAFGPKHHTTD